MSLSNPQDIDKTAVARSFGRAAEAYDAAAHFQRWVADRLFEGIPSGALTPGQTLLDLGCGTGYCLEKWREKTQHPQSGAVLGLDISLPMLQFARAKLALPAAQWVVADAETLPFKTASIDLVCSSLAIQWCSGTEALFAEIARVLEPGGWFCFSTLLDGTLHELKQSWAQADSAQHVNQFATLSHYQAAITRAGLEVVSLQAVRHVLRYDNVRGLLGELKAIGAHNVTPERSRAVTPKSVYRRFEAAYEQLRDAQGQLPASYEILIAYVRR